MIPYFTPLLPGELFYSALARTLRLYPEKSIGAAQCSWLLGSYKHSFGVLLPSHGRKLLSQIPVAAGLNDETLLSASLFPVIAPFLEAGATAQLRSECIEAEHPHLHGWLIRGAKRTPVFRYCPACSQEDVAAGRPHHWRIVHQHPNVFVCPHHGTELVQLRAAPLAAPGALFPGDWIKPERKLPRTAHPLECFVARSLQWLLEENNLMPGGIRLRRAMLNALRASPRYSAAGKGGWNALLLEDISRDTDAQCRQRNDLNLYSVRHWTSSISSKISQERNFSRFAYGCYALGISLPELFAAAMALPDPADGTQHSPATGDH